MGLVLVTEGHNTFESFPDLMKMNNNKEKLGWLSNKLMGEFCFKIYKTTLIFHYHKKKSNCFVFLFSSSGTPGFLYTVVDH